MALSGESSILSGISGVTIQDFQLASAQWNVQEKLKAIKDGEDSAWQLESQRVLNCWRVVVRVKREEHFNVSWKNFHPVKTLWVILEWSWRSSLRGARVMERLWWSVCHGWGGLFWLRFQLQLRILSSGWPAWLFYGWSALHPHSQIDLRHKKKLVQLWERLNLKYVAMSCAGGTNDST